jgi:uracil-DNA glycosylase family protein
MTEAHDRPPAPVPARPTIRGLAAAVQDCRACDLWEPATAPVMGEGPRKARLMLVGEQPGDREDRAGHVFVGPAGKVLDDALERVGIDRDAVYLTNIVKHFRYRTRGKRRIHQAPDRRQVNACLPWLRAEMKMVAPDALVLLGAVAAQGLLGSQIRIGRDRGRPIDSDLAELVMVTTHPSAVLRAGDYSDRRAAMDAFVADLERVVSWLGQR